jgi:hypothetical protein
MIREYGCRTPLVRHEPNDDQVLSGSANSPLSTGAELVEERRKETAFWRIAG